MFLRAFWFLAAIAVVVGCGSDKTTSPPAATVNMPSMSVVGCAGITACSGVNKSNFGYVFAQGTTCASATGAGGTHAVTGFLARTVDAQAQASFSVGYAGTQWSASPSNIEQTTIAAGTYTVVGQRANAGGLASIAAGDYVCCKADYVLGDSGVTFEAADCVVK